jgi:uncharacterized membrane protein
LEVQIQKMNKKSEIQVLEELLSTYEVARDVAEQHELQAKTQKEAWTAVCRDLRCAIKEVKGLSEKEVGRA